MRTPSTGGVAAALLILLAARAGAQSVSGQVTQAETGTPVRGAIVLAFNARGDTVPATLSGSTGRFSLPIPAGRIYTLWIRSIGRKPFRVDVGPLAAGRDSTLNVRLDPVLITLPPVEVATAGECLKLNTGVTQVSEVWAQVTNALESSRVSARLLRREFDWRIVETETDARTGQLRFSNSNTVKSLTTRPFRSVGTRELSRRGYVVVDALGVVFRSPDETVLQDETFITTHCFWATAGSGPSAGLFALHFAPITGGARNDIEGTFWLDANTSELQSLEFNYTRTVVTRRAGARPSRLPSAAVTVQNDSLLPPIPPRLMSPGGELRFKRLDDGSVIVDSWRMWVTDNWPSTNLNGAEPLPRPNIFRENGGSILRIGGGGQERRRATHRARSS